MATKIVLREDTSGNGHTNPPTPGPGPTPTPTPTPKPDPTPKPTPSGGKPVPTGKTARKSVVTGFSSSYETYIKKAIEDYYQTGLGDS